MLAPGLYTGLQVEWMMTWMLNHSSYCRSRASFWGISVKITANDVSALASWEFLFSEKQWRSRWLCETALAFFLNRSMDEGRGRVPAHIVCIFPSQHERKWTQRLNIQTVHCTSGEQLLAGTAGGYEAVLTYGRGVDGWLLGWTSGEGDVARGQERGDGHVRRVKRVWFLPWMDIQSLATWESPKRLCVWESPGKKTGSDDYFPAIRSPGV